MSSFPSAKGELFRYSQSAAACVAFEYDLSSAIDQGQSDSGPESSTTNPTTSSSSDAAAPLTSATKKKIAVVVVGGLTDGFFAVPYLQNLADLLQEKNKLSHSSSPFSLSLITPLLSSSHTGWGAGSLERDAAELLELARHLAGRGGGDSGGGGGGDSGGDSGLRRRSGFSGIVLVGHSTGCQDSVRFAQRYKEEEKEEEEEERKANEDAAAAATTTATTTKRRRLPRLVGVVLQAPVSDRECFFLNAETAPMAQELLERAKRVYDKNESSGERGKKVGEGEGEREERQKEEDPGRNAIIGVMSSWDGAPLSASRWRSLASWGGDDDMFSSDFTDEELEERVGRHLRGVPTLVIASQKEQYLPESYDTAAQARRLAEAITRGEGGAKREEASSSSPIHTSAEAISLDGDHSLRGAEAEAAEAIVDFIFRKCLC